MNTLYKSLMLPALLLTTSLALAGGPKPHMKVTAAQAQKAALAKYHGKVVSKVELENEEGKWQYSVMIQSGKVLREVMIDANTGKIANVEVTSAAKEAKEKAAESHHKPG